MRKILLSIFIACSVIASGQALLNTKYIPLATCANPYQVNLAGNTDVFFASGTKSLSAPFSITTTGTPVDGKTILLFWDGTSITTNTNIVTLLGVALAERQITKKLIVLSTYKTSAWETRIFADVTSTSWIGKDDIDTATFLDNTTLEIDGTNGLQVKAGGIASAQISAAAAIPYSKLSLSNSIVAADVSTAAAIPYTKLSLAGTLLNSDMSTSCAFAWNKMAAQTASRVMVTDASGYGTTSTATATEIGYLSGVTSNIQTQLNTARNNKTYTQSSTATLVLSSTATDSYILNTTGNAIAVTLPDAADFDQYHTIVFTRQFASGSYSVVISPCDGNVLEGSAGSDVASYTLSGTTGEGVEFVSNGVDTWIFLRKW